MGLGVQLNNPGNLTVASLNDTNAYEGQTGTRAANKLVYAIFGSAQAGANALTTWLSNNIGTNDQTSLTTPSELTSYYLNGSFGPLQNTANNPAAGKYLASVDASTGLSPNSSLSSVSVNSIAAGIQHAEGNDALGNLFGAASNGQDIGGTGTGSDLLSGASSWLSTEVNNFTKGAGYIQQNGIVAGSAVLAGADPASAATNPVGSLTSSLFAPLISWLNAQEKSFTSADIPERVVFGLVAFVLLAAGIFFLVQGPKIVQNVTKAAAIAA